jgi:membrane protein DedA with SNARE-associated domain
MEKKKPKNKKVNSFVIFSGIGLQMGLTIYLGSYAGKWLDAKYEMEKPIFTLSLILFFFIVSMYSLIKRLNKMNENE